jgi:peptidoglycan hydrolase CwlO-like protein
MGKVEEAIDKLIRSLESIGYSTDEAVNKVNNDLENAKAEVEAYNDWIEERVSVWIETRW